MPDVSTFNEPFDGSALNPAVWADPYPDFGTLTVSGGKVASSGMHIAVATIEAGWTFAVGSTLTFHIKEGAFPGYVQCGIQGVKVFSWYDYQPGSEFLIKFVRHVVAENDGIDGYWSTDGGATWTYFGAMLLYSAYTPASIFLDFEGQWECLSIVGGTEGSGGDPLDEPPYDYEGPYDAPDVEAAEASCATLLELIQQFSAAVRRAVRITGSTSIAMVDPIAPLPSGWTQADADGLYHSSSREQRAGDKTLSANHGDLALSGSAGLIRDDVRLITSGWQIPNRLPVFGLHPSPVQRVTYEFTPKSFKADVEYAFHTVPAEVRRT